MDVGVSRQRKEREQRPRLLGKAANQKVRITSSISSIKRTILTFLKLHTANSSCGRQLLFLFPFLLSWQKKKKKKKRVTQAMNSNVNYCGISQEAIDAIVSDLLVGVAPADQLIISLTCLLVREWFFAEVIFFYLHYLGSYNFSLVLSPIR